MSASYYIGGAALLLALAFIIGGDIWYTLTATSVRVYALSVNKVKTKIGKVKSRASEWAEIYLRTQWARPRFNHTKCG